MNKTSILFFVWALSFKLTAIEQVIKNSDSPMYLASSVVSLLFVVAGLFALNNK